MRRSSIIFVLALGLIISGCKPADPIADEEVSSEDQTGAIKGFVWLDLNADGIASRDEPRIAGVSVDLHFANSPITSEIVVTDENGEYNAVAGVGEVFSVRFTLPDEYEEHPFTKRDIGPENTDSDVNPVGETAFFTLTEEFSIWLSAGILPVEPYASSLEIEDARGDCSVRGQEELQECEGDIHRCEVVQDPESFQYSFTCTLGQVTDYTQFDFYVTLNLDGDPATGKSEGQAQGVDAEIYLNTQELRIQINHYDLTGNYIRGDVLGSNVAHPVLGTANEGEIGITITQWADDLRQLFEQNPQASFVLVTYPPSGGQLIDDTGVLSDSITLPGIE